MKRQFIAYALVLSLVFAFRAPAHSDEIHGKNIDRHANGHTVAIGKPGDPGKVTRDVE